MLDLGDERTKTVTITLAIAMALMGILLAFKGSQGLQYILVGLKEGSVYALIAMGFSVIYASTRIINFAQGEFTMLGAMIMYSFYTALGVPLPLAFIITVLMVTLIGAGMERLTIHPLKGASVVTLIIITIGAAIFLKAAALWIWGAENQPVAPFSGDRTIRIFKASLPFQSVWVFGLMLLAVILMYLFFNHTITGKGMRAAAINRDAASLVGVNPSTSSLLSFSIAAALGAAAGVVIAPMQSSYSMGTMLGLNGFAAAVLGGLGSAPGAVLGGLLIGVAEFVAAGLMPFGYSGYSSAVPFVILILVLLVRPQGLMGRKEDIKY